MASGLTACVVAYAVLDHFFLKPLPYRDPDRIVAIVTGSKTMPAERLGDDVDRPVMTALSSHAAFAEVGGWYYRNAFWGLPAEDLIRRWFASSSLFAVLGVEPALGRLFTSAEDTAPSDVALISWSCWQRRFAGRADVLGQTITIADADFAGEPPERRRIIGVLPRGFALTGEPPEVVVPIGFLPPDVGSFFLVARLAPGVDIETAQGVADRLVSIASWSPSGKHASVVPLRQALMLPLRPPFWMLVTVPGALLALATASAMGLLLSELLGRRQEFAVRLSVGADRNTIRRELIIEHALRSVLAAVITFGGAALLIRLLSALVPAELYGGTEPRLDYRLFLSGLTGATSASLLVGLWAIRLVIGKGLSFGSAASHRSAPQQLRAHRIAAVVQLAMSFTLLACATLLVRTLMNLTGHPLGFDPSKIAVISVRASAWPESAPRSANSRGYLESWTHTEALLDVIDRLPGVIGSAAMSAVPFGKYAPTIRLRVDTPAAELFEVQSLFVTNNYWKLLGVPILAGRGLEPQDRRRDRNQKVTSVVASQSLDRDLGGNSVGRRLAGERGAVLYEIVGVVAEARQKPVASSGVPTIYALVGRYDSVRSVLVKTSVAPDMVLPAVRDAILNYDRTVLVTQATTMSSLLSGSIAAERFRTLLGTSTAVIGLFLATLGIFLLGRRLVEMRQREIGVRVALGASTFDVVRTVLRDTVPILGLGVAAGWLASYWAAYSLRGLFVGVSWFEPNLFLFAAVVLLAATTLATVGTVRLALRTDPAIVLRTDG